jgi:hypothetical protein
VELGVFTEAEVSKIAAKRMNHEFAIAKRNASLMDYLRYIAVCARARLVLFLASFAQHAFREWIRMGWRTLAVGSNSGAALSVLSSRVARPLSSKSTSRHSSGCGAGACAYRTTARTHCTWASAIYTGAWVQRCVWPRRELCPPNPPCVYFPLPICTPSCAVWRGTQWRAARLLLDPRYLRVEALASGQSKRPNHHKADARG